MSEHKSNVTNNNDDNEYAKEEIAAKRVKNRFIFSKIFYVYVNMIVCPVCVCVFAFAFAEELYDRAHSLKGLFSVFSL